ncbi:argininosuccinate synthase [bacterium]|nr:argininosuccinate synthase [bacterium]
MNKILLAYSGGLDTSCILKWLAETYDAEIIAYCADVGQKEDYAEVEKKALALGASKCIIDDLKAEFVAEYVFTAIKGNTVYESEYLLGTSLARPCIAKGMVEAALRNNCDAIAHGATGKGNDQVRFELAVKSLAPHLKVIAPWRTWKYKGRVDLFAYAREKGIELPVTLEKPYSMDANIMHISYEGGILEDPAAAPPDDIYLWTKSPEEAPDKAETVEIEFEQGVPVKINGEKLAPLELLEKANDIAAAHGVGRIDVVENRYIGIKSRGVYETPGATILIKAHQALESICLDKEVDHLKEELSKKLAIKIYNGYWTAPETKLLINAIEETQKTVSGIVKLKLYKGSATILSRASQYSLYSAEIAGFDTMDAFTQQDSEGFININGLRLSTWSAVNESVKSGIQSKA